MPEPSEISQEELKREELLKRLLKPPPQPRPKREREKGEKPKSGDSRRLRL